MGPFHDDKELICTNGLTYKYPHTYLQCQSHAEKWVAIEEDSHGSIFMGGTFTFFSSASGLINQMKNSHEHITSAIDLKCVKVLNEWPVEFSSAFWWFMIIPDGLDETKAWIGTYEL